MQTKVGRVRRDTTFFWSPGSNLVEGTYLQIGRYLTTSNYSDVNNLLNWVKSLNKDNSNFVQADKTKLGINDTVVENDVLSSINVKRNIYYIRDKPLIQVFRLNFSDDATGSKTKIVGEEILNTVKVFSPSGSFNPSNSTPDPVEQLQEANFAKSQLWFEGIQRTLYLYFRDKGNYPINLNTLAESNYTNSEGIIDPITNAPFIYQQLQNGLDYRLCSSQKCVTKIDFSL